MATIREVLEIAKKRIELKGLEENASLLLMEEVNGFTNRTSLLLNLDSEMKNEDLFNFYLMEYLSFKPVQYILHKAWFLGETFYVDKRVLIPRMETEELVEKAIEIASKINEPLIYDVCTGSGCIALTLAKRLKNASIVGSDISSDALEVANINRNALKVNNVKFIESDLFIKYPLVKADIIVSNPPYVDKSEVLDKMVKDFEPSFALIPPSGNGLEFYQRFFIALPSYLKEGGYFIAEFGENQKDDIELMIKKFLSNSKVTFYKDISSKDRFFVLQFFRLN